MAVTFILARKAPPESKEEEGEYGNRRTGAGFLCELILQK